MKQTLCEQFSGGELHVQNNIKKQVKDLFHHKPYVTVRSEPFEATDSKLSIYVYSIDRIKITCEHTVLCILEW